MTCLSVRVRALAWALVVALVGASLGVMAAPGRASATIIVESSLEELAAQAQVVVLGEVLEVESRWEEIGESKLIVTRVVMATERGVKGAAQGGRVEFWTLGGQVDGLAQRVSGEPTFRVSERAVVFLAPRGDVDARLWVSGMAQGAYRVVSTTEGGDVAVRDTSGLTLADVKAHWDPASATVRQVAAIKPDAIDVAAVRPLPALLDEVERLVKARP
jgi:hypothetical protein